MAAFVLDASVAITWCFPGDPTEDTPYSRRVLKELVANDAIVPDIWAYEIANNIFVSYRKRKRISEQHITEYLSLLRALPIRVESQSLWANVNLESLARRQNIAAYDAAYLDLASPRRMNCSDRQRLRRALRCLPKIQPAARPPISDASRMAVSETTPTDGLLVGRGFIARKTHFATDKHGTALVVCGAQINHYRA
jgi:predicted nucleic acid-binding protein